MKPRHVMILASAGSGKTYALTNRFVELLAAGARPERIVALTFTRKAAGEFFDKILEKLARAATEPARARSLAAEIGRPELGPADFLALLAAVVEAMPRLRLGTLDGFFAGIVQAFPLELGLAGDFEIMDEYVARAERRRVLQRMFAGSQTGLTPAQVEFAEAFKRATFGREEKRLGARLDEFLDQHHRIWLAAPDPARWGEPDRIWPEGCEWLETPGDALAAVETLRAWLEQSAPAEKQRRRWEEFFSALAAWRPGGEVGRALVYVLRKALDAWPDLRAGRAVLEFERRRQELPPPACRALQELVRRVVGGELRRHLEMTRGLAHVLRGYEAVYDESVRRAGRLGFDDVQRLLEPGAGGRPLAQEAGEAGRLQIDYRLDAEIDHWLLDEFQDTSHAQWSVLQNLIDEAMQDPEERRSFFCVGDVKQAIYGWRGGEARLFREILSYYESAQPGVIEERALVHSWRSGPPLIEMVNAVFGARDVLAAWMPGAATARWNEEWRDHVSAVPDRTGQAALLHAEDEEARRDLMLRLIREISPVERGLTCAVLVRQNTTAAELAEFLRSGGVPAVADADLQVCIDHPAGTALLALVRAAAHPGDTLAQEHWRMTPLGAIAAAEGWAASSAVSQRILAQIHRGGFESFAEDWARRLEPTLAPDDGFSRRRLRQFVAAAAEFDATGRREVSEFAAFMEAYTLREVENEAVVRVMTVHKAKGLGFDVVILPDLGGRKADEAREGLGVKRSADRSVEWVLDLPGKLFCEADPALARISASAEADAGFEAVALLYVAMTRAQRAMYLLAEPAGDSVARNYTRLLADVLGDASDEVRIGALTTSGSWSRGDPAWFTASTSRMAGEGSGLGSIPGIEAPMVARYPAQIPSDAKAVRHETGRWFSIGEDPVDFGKSVHALLAEIEWWEPGTGAISSETWRLAAPEVVAAANRCLQASGLERIWRRRPGAELWRERTFEIVLDGVWVSGVFDRVILQRDHLGVPVGAEVFDFKTDRILGDEGMSWAVARHADQLHLYRRVVAVLAQVPESAVSAEVVFSQNGQSRLVAPP